MLNICLVEPEIPPNTGNIARLCAATFTNLHIVGVTGFRLDEKAVKRAGLDYWERVYTDWQFWDNDCLVFGRETKGLPEQLLKANWERCLKIPMPNENVRSLNLANSVAIVLFEALRQCKF
jgi:tRNA (cytidine/uridine-2'-O-)-methyltransferase